MAVGKPGLAKHCCRRDGRFGDHKVLSRCKNLQADPEEPGAPNWPAYVLRCCCMELQRVQHRLGLTPPCWRQHLDCAISSSTVLLGSSVVIGEVAASGSWVPLLCRCLGATQTLTQALWSISQRPAWSWRLSRSCLTIPGGSQWTWVLHLG